MDAVLSQDGLLQAAGAVLRANDLGHMMKAGPALYPHQWSWDAAFIAIGLAQLDVSRAITELRTVLAAQWSTGMLPHIVFSDQTDYFPGPEAWRTADAPARPAGIQTSGICQPPVHAIAVRSLLDTARRAGGAAQAEAEEFVRESIGRLASWHDWLSGSRVLDPHGLVEIHHGWESGMDNSPRFDSCYAAVHPRVHYDLPRTDLQHADASERPTDTEYQRYLWLVNQLADVHFDDALAARTVDFRCGDVFLTAVLALAADDLAVLADDLGDRERAEAERARADTCRAAVAASLNPDTGLCRDYDLRAQAWIRSETIAGFSLLICGGPDALVTQQRRLLLGERWMGHRSLRFPLPPSVTPESPDYRPRTYWRGPVWPIMNWLLAHAALLRGDRALADALRGPGLEQLAADGHFAEYYQPATGEPLGSPQQSWTAMAAIDWLCDPRWTVP
ncbi:MAG: hypothetical protein VB036_01070 [Propionicimonas sp.]|nr:hypothetical protein [Propionicimonas sp.]